MEFKFFKRRKQDSSAYVHFLGVNRQIAVSRHESLLDLALRHKISIPTSCGGSGTCGTCRVIVVEGDLPAPNPIEKEHAELRGFSEGERLACQIPAVAGMKVKIP